MGKMSIILVLAAMLTGGALMYNVQRTTGEADDQTAAYHFEFLAREAALAGLDNVMRGVLSGVTATIPPGNWSPFNVAETSHEGGYYAVTGTVGNCSGLADLDTIATRPNFIQGQHLMEVISTGRYDTQVGDVYDVTGERDIYHQIKTCYVKLDVSDATPPAFEYAFIADSNFTFNGNVDIEAIDGEGNIHSNDQMKLGPQVVIDGHVTYTETDNPTCEANPASCTSTMKNGTTVSSFDYGPSVPLVEFDPEDYRTPVAHREDAGFTLSSAMTIAPTVWPPSDPDLGVGTAGNPFVWFIDGDMTLSGGAHLTLPAYTIIVVNGVMDVSGNANITVNGQVRPTSAAQGMTLEETTLAWIADNTTADGKSKLAFYVDGDATINGTGSIVGNFYTNEDFTLNGGGQGTNMVGSVTALGTITANGGGNGHNFWYMAAAQEVIIPGVMVPLELISMVAISEWSDPVIKHDGHGLTTP